MLKICDLVLTTVFVQTHYHLGQSEAFMKVDHALWSSETWKLEHADYLLQPLTGWRLWDQKTVSHGRSWFSREPPRPFLWYWYIWKVCFQHSRVKIPSLGIISKGQPWSHGILSCTSLRSWYNKANFTSAPKLELICWYKISGNVIFQFLSPLSFARICPWEYFTLLGGDNFWFSWLCQ